MRSNTAWLILPVFIAGIVIGLLVPKLRETIHARQRKPASSVSPKRQPSPSATQTSTQSRKGYPRFEDIVGHFADSKKFIKFIDDNVGNIVYIDISIAEDEFDGEIKEPTQFFVLWDECYEKLKPGKKPGSDSCTGYEFNINNTAKTTDYTFVDFRGSYILHGYFAILGIAGPHQGLMGVSMKPMSMESIAPGLAE